MKRAKSGHFCIQLDTLTLRGGAPPRLRSLPLGEPEPMVSKFYGSPRHSSAPPKRTSSPRHSIASPMRTC